MCCANTFWTECESKPDFAQPPEHDGKAGAARRFSETRMVSQYQICDHLLGSKERGSSFNVWSTTLSSSKLQQCRSASGARIIHFEKEAPPSFFSTFSVTWKIKPTMRLLRSPSRLHQRLDLRKSDLCVCLCCMASANEKTI